MNKKLLSLILSAALILCQGSALAEDPGTDGETNTKTEISENLENVENIENADDASAVQTADHDGDVSLFAVQSDGEDILYDFTDGTDGFAPNDSRILLSAENGAMRYESVLVNNASGWMTREMRIDGEVYNRVTLRMKVESVHDQINKNKYGFHIYWNGHNKSTGEGYGAAGSRSLLTEFTGLTVDDGFSYNADWVEYTVDLSSISKWSESNISKFRIDAIKDAAGVVYIDYIKLWHYEPPRPNPEPEPEMKDGEGWYSDSFSSGVDGWVSSYKNQITLSQLDDCMQYDSKFLYSGGKASSGWMTKNVSFKRGQYYKLLIKARVLSAGKTIDNQSPYITMYYTGKTADGTTLGAATGRSGNISYDVAENEDGTYSSEWKEYEFDLSKLNSWNLCDISQIRFDMLKNGEGTVFVDYIRFLSYPCIDGIEYDGNAVTEGTRVPLDVKKIDAILSQKILSLDASCVSIYNEDRAKLGVENVSYDAASGRVSVSVSGTMESNSTYTFEIGTGAKVNANQNLYTPIAKSFKTAAAEFEVSVTAADTDSANVIFENSSVAAKKVLAIATLWDGDKYVGKVILPCTVETGTSDVVLRFAQFGGNRAEVTVWELSGTSPRVFGKRVYTVER